MVAMSRVLVVRLGIFFATGLGVFVLPFLFPPPYFQGVSASNLAGFNNRVAAVAAAGMAILVFFLSLMWPQIGRWNSDGAVPGDEQIFAGDNQLPRWLIATVVLLWGFAVSLFGVLILRSGVTYVSDWGYFINRASMHADFGRRLYTQIEFPYGPLLLYCPIAVKTLLSPFHLSLAASYAVALTLGIVIGLLLVAYVIDHLPMSRGWKALIFLLLAGGMLPVNMGLNYTFIRFAPPLAFLVMASQRKRAWAAILWIFAGQAVCLGLSPEIGFAFFVSSFGYAAYRCWQEGWQWVPGPIAPVLSTAAFLLFMGLPYLRMVGMYAHGVMSFPVEPQPHILVFLFALVWLVPVMLADHLREPRPEAPMLIALCLVSLALLPAAFGRADPWHVFWNGLSIFLLAAVAVSYRPLPQQLLWGCCLGVMFFWMCNLNRRGYYFETHPVMHYGVEMLAGRTPQSPETDEGFDLGSLQAIVGHDPVVLPGFVPRVVEQSLRRAGQFAPTFYYFQTAVLDTAAEAREIEEFNHFKWALIKKGPTMRSFERPEDLQSAIGWRLPYRTKRPVYMIGPTFDENLQKNWRVRGQVGSFVVYERL